MISTEGHSVQWQTNSYPNFIADDHNRHAINQDLLQLLWRVKCVQIPAKAISPQKFNKLFIITTLP